MPRLLFAGLLVAVFLTACGPSKSEETARATADAASATLESLQSSATATAQSVQIAATVQAAVEATQAAMPTATSLPATPTATPVPPSPTSTSVPPTPTVVPPTATRVPLTPTPLPQATVNHQPLYMVVDGHESVLSDLESAGMPDSVKNIVADAKIARDLASGAFARLDAGSRVQTLSAPGPHGTHITILTGRNAGKSGVVLNRTIAP